MVSDAQKKITKKVSKLLALSEDDAASEAEARTARRKAEELMAEHSISFEDVGDSAFRVERWEIKYSAVPGWYQLLTSGISAYLGTYVLKRTGRGRDHNAYYFICGHEDDIETQKYMLGALSAKVQSMTDEFRRERDGAARSVTNSYRNGLVLTLKERLEELVDSVSIRQEKQEEGLVLRDEIHKKRERAEEMIMEWNDTTPRSAGKVSSKDKNAYVRGRQDGHHISLHKGAPEGRDDLFLSDSNE